MLKFFFKDFWINNLSNALKHKPKSQIDSDEFISVSLKDIQKHQKLSGINEEPNSMPLFQFDQIEQLKLKILAEQESENAQLNPYLKQAKAWFAFSMLTTILMFCLPTYKLIEIGYRSLATKNPGPTIISKIERGEIIDRHGELIASNLPTMTLQLSHARILNLEETIKKINGKFPYVNVTELKKSIIEKPNGYSIIAQNLSWDDKQKILLLGLPELEFLETYQRIYPQGRNFAHIVGFVNTAQKGVLGIERAYNAKMSAGQTVQLTLDVRVQNIIRTELAKTMTEFHAVGGGAVLVDVKTGEVISMLSLPDFNPNNVENLKLNNIFNMMTQGVYELGSTMKLLTFAQAYENQLFRKKNMFHVELPLMFGNFQIKDYHPINRPISGDEIFIFSSNVGSALIAENLFQNDVNEQKKFFSELQLLKKLPIEIAEVGTPIIPKQWGELETATIAYGHGISLSPLHFTMAAAALLGDGILKKPIFTINKVTTTTNPTSKNFFSNLWTYYQPYFPKLLPNQNAKATETTNTGADNLLVSAKTTAELRRLMRLNVLYGSARKAEVLGYEVGGKTGTAEKPISGGYNKDLNLISLISIFPASEPKYILYVVLNDTKRGVLASTALAPLTGKIISATAPMLDVLPNRELQQQRDAWVEEKSIYQLKNQ